jgi:hypothetical protein
VDAGGGRWAGGQAIFRDWLATPDASAVRAAVEPADGGVDPRDLVQGLRIQRGRMLPLESERRALRVMLVVGARLAGGFGDARELEVKGGRPLLGTRPFRQ